ncbi:MAG: HAD hydrolase-like protein [Nanoarchaeota archaeon]|nr:HAD hydrolase-like protein [Nanoarchaeota archaeon]
MDNTLSLWDIDGNLVNVYKFHTPAYQLGIREVFGVEVSFPEIETHYGKPAREVVSAPLRKKGISDNTIENGVGRVLSIYSSQLEKMTSSLMPNEATLPGVLPLLHQFRKMGIPMGIVTGNIKIAGEAILKGTNLYGLFDSRISSYGDNATERYQIVSNSIESAKKFNLIKNNAKVYVFGDTPSDVEAAKKNNCKSIAVVKNSNNKDSSPGGENYLIRKTALIESKPDFLFDDYTDTFEILRLIGLKNNT